MDIPGNINIVTVAIACIFAAPIVFGLLFPKINRPFESLLYNLIFLGSVLLSFYLTRLLLLDPDNAILSFVYGILPQFRAVITSGSVWVYAYFIAIIQLLLNGAFYLLLLPLHKPAVRLSESVSSAFDSMHNVPRRIVGGLWQIPKSVWLVLLFSILLNFFTGHFGSSAITAFANNSVPYQMIQSSVIQPLLNSSVIKDIQVIVKDSFKTADSETPDAAEKEQLIIYFNGVTLSEAVKSNAAIDAMAKQIVGTETDGMKKALLLYRWVSSNIKYDYNKAEALAKKPTGISSGAIVAFTTKKGICFDYSCLYVAMCRATGLRVRFITGLGYTGTVWGDHAWNQVYNVANETWINVDTTFGSSGINYFNRANFNADHSKGTIHGEWK